MSHKSQGINTRFKSPDTAPLMPNNHFIIGFQKISSIRESYNISEIFFFMFIYYLEVHLMPESFGWITISNTIKALEYYIQMF